MADRNPPSTTVVQFETHALSANDPKNLMMVDRLLSEHATSVARTCLPTLREIRSLATPEARAAETQHHRQAIQGMLVRAATEQTLEAIGTALDTALSAEPNEGAVEVSLAALIDSRMRLPHNLPIFVEAAIFDLVDLGFPPAVVAAACQRIRREKTYFPEISEIIAACRETLDRYRDQQKRVVQALSDRRQAERWLAQLNGPEFDEGPAKAAPPRDDAQPGDPDWR